MNKNNTFLLVLAVIVFGAGIIGFVAQKDSPDISSGLENEEKLVLSDENKPDGEDVAINGSSLETEEVIPSGVSPALPSDVAVPDLDRPVVFTEEFLPEQKEEITKEIKEISASLEKDAGLFSEWLGLGLLRKSIGDHEGARQAWEYASALRPQNSLSFANLGVLYGYYLASPIKAEANFLKAIDNDPKQVYMYSQIADFYVEVMEDVDKAKDILRQGIAENPAEEGLKIQLEALE